MNQEEQDQFPLVSFLGFFKKFHLTLGFSNILIGLVFFILKKPDLTLYSIGILPLLAYLYFIIRTKPFYPIKQQKSLTWAIWILAISLIGIITLMYFGQKTNNITFNSLGIEISGMYGEKIPFSEIKEVSLCHHLPKIKYKTNGYASSQIKKGYFKTEDGEKVKLLISNLEPPYLLITKTNEKKIYYGQNSPKNKALMQELSKYQHYFAKEIR